MRTYSWLAIENLQTTDKLFKQVTLSERAAGLFWKPLQILIWEYSFKWYAAIWAAVRVFLLSLAWDHLEPWEASPGLSTRPHLRVAENNKNWKG